MKWASALSRDTDAGPAVDRAVEVLNAELEGATPDLLLAFVSWSFARDAGEIGRKLRAAFPGARLVGCTGGGVIGAGREAEDVPAISITAASLPGVTLQTFHTLGELPVQEEPPAACVLLVDPFTCDSAAVVAGLDEAYPGTVKIGGLASGGTSPGAHPLWLDDAVHRGGVVGVAMWGAVKVDTIVAQGCRPFGPPMFATRVDGHLLVELDQRPPLEVLKALHDGACDDDRRRMRHSLHVGLETKTGAVEHQQGELLVRNIVGVDEGGRALAIGAVLKQYDVVQFMLRDARAAEEDLDAALARAREDDPTPPAGALLFSCTGRGSYLFGCADHDTSLFAEAFGPTPLGGFFCNGEIGPVAGRTWLHGYTSAFAMFRPRH